MIVKDNPGYSVSLKTSSGKPVKIIYEDNHLFVINKPSGLLVQGDKTGDEDVLSIVKNFIKVRDKKPGNVFLGLPHRLDRPTSGVVVLAKTSKALSRLTEEFRSRNTEKIYWAITYKKPPEQEDLLIHYLVKDSRTNTSKAVKASYPGAKEAKLRYRLIASSDRYFLLEVHLLTGRHHQIRVQLASIGCVIKGDLKYGAKRSNPDGGISLHARSLKLKHPVKKTEDIFTASPPDATLWNYFKEKCLAEINKLRS